MPERRPQADSGIGRALPRIEDERLLTGLGHFSADVSLEGVCHAAIVRSPHAHARILGIDASVARTMPGVLAILTGADVAADGLSPIPHNPNWTGPPDAVLRIPDGFEVFITPHAILPEEIVRHVGEPVAVVVAETEQQAMDAAECVAVEYEPLASVVDARKALQSGAPQLWPGCPRNLSLTCEVGDKAATERAFASAAHIVQLDTVINRVTGSPMEPRSVTGVYDDARERYILYAASGAGVVRTRERLATVLNVPIEDVRCVFGDMGGNFGTRNAFYPEYALIPWVARRVGRAVSWTATRSECFVSDYQARDLASKAELALDQDGNFLALRGVNTANLGAYTVFFWPLRKGLSMMQGVYRIPSVWFEGHAVLTNTMPTAVYRSAGRPEAIFVVERLIDLAARELGMDRVELRRRNLIDRDEFPYRNAVGVTYDSGDYAAVMDDALEVADWEGFAARKATSAARGLCRGIGIANYIEVTSGIPRERVELSICEDGSIDFAVGTMSSGQGHETTFRQLICEWLQVPTGRIRYVANDSDRISVGGGSHSGRSMRLVSIAAFEAVEGLIARSKRIAAHVLQSSPHDVEYACGTFSVPGGGSIDLAGIAVATREHGDLPEDLRALLQGVGDITNQAGGYPYGTHICEVEVDPDTGRVQIVAWTGVDDVGRAVNPLVLHGQAHGAIAQGVGQALLEDIRYDEETGQLLTGSYMDYAMPRADDLPRFRTKISEVPASSHPHGMRPGGEGGTTPALAALVSAVVDALSAYGVAHIDIPLTPERVWRAISDAERGRGAG